MHKQDVAPGAVELVQTFPAKFPNVSHFYFKSCLPGPGIEERLEVRQVPTLTALPIRQLVARCSDAADQMLKGTDVNESSSWIRVSAVEFASGFFQLQSECHDRGEALALCSFCEDSSSGELHIPIMDFRIESETGAHLNLLKEVLTKVGQTDGVLLNSGKSYHYYGFRLLTERDWRRFMVTCLLLGPLVDIRYISHRLLAGTAALRLMTAPGKPKAPEVVAYLKG